MRSFRSDKRGIFWVAWVAVTTIIIATLLWLVAMVVTGEFVDLFGAQATGPMTLSLGETVRTQGSVLVIIIDVGMVIWLFVSAFARERQEAPLQ